VQNLIGSICIAVFDFTKKHQNFTKKVVISVSETITTKKIVVDNGSENCYIYARTAMGLRNQRISIFASTHTLYKRHPNNFVSLQNKNKQGYDKHKAVSTDGKGFYKSQFWRRYGC